MSTKYRQKLFFADLQHEQERGQEDNGAEKEKRPKRKRCKRQKVHKTFKPTLVRPAPSRC